MGNEYGKGKNILTGKVTPADQRRMLLEKKKAAAALAAGRVPIPK
jgi:hypothetical protein